MIEEERFSNVRISIFPNNIYDNSLEELFNECENEGLNMFKEVIEFIEKANKML